MIDASAMLALLHREPGAAAVAMILGAGVMSTVNWAEVLQKARGHGVDVTTLREDLSSLGVEFVPFSIADAELTAELWHGSGRALGLADRACIATARRTGYAVVTADRAWSEVDLGIPAKLIR